MKNLIKRLTHQGPSRKPEPLAELSVGNDFEALEPRMLFSAAPVEAPDDANVEVEQPEAAAEQVVVTASDAQVSASSLEAVEMTREGEIGDSTVPDQEQTALPVVSEATAIEASRTVNLVDLSEESATLNQETLKAIADAAAERWRATGLTAEQSAALDNITYEVSDLGGNYLGKAEGYAITIDDDAAGSDAWFIDPTPGADEEFIQLGVHNSLTAISGTDAPEHYDLLTVVLHEQGHALGLPDRAAGESNLMYSLLWEGERRLPQAEQAAGFQPGSITGPAFIGAAPIFADSGQNLGNSSSTSVSLGDVDNDGDLDAFVANSSYQGDRVWLNDGSGTFTDSGQNLGDSAGAAVSLGDLDNDGDLDAFVANSAMSGSANKVWLNDGSGIFSDSGQNLGRSASAGVSLGDVDADGDLDALVTNTYYSQGDVRVWLNNGSGIFSDSGQRLGNSRSVEVSLGDFDDDGDLDAFVVNGSNQGDTVWLNNGTGIFADSGQSLGNADGRGVSLGDVDNDGDLDAFVSNIGNGRGESNRVWLNNGSGNFTDSGQNLGNDSGFGASLGDVDRDGDLDAFVANGSPFSGESQANRIWLNDGSGVFTDSGDRLADNFSVWMALGDFDSDGDLDAFIANLGTGNRVWINQSPPPPAENEAAVNGGDLTIDTDGDGDTVSLVSDGTNLRISTPDDSIEGGSGTTSESNGDVLVPIAGLTSITLNTGDDDDTINIGDLTGFAGDLIIDGGEGQDTITQSGDVTLTESGSASYDAEKIIMRVGATLSTDSGDVTMNGTGSTGNTKGIELQGAEILSNTGDVNLTGQGGTTGNFNQGISVKLFAATSSTIQTGGEITLTGTGGSGGVFGTGVAISGSTVESTGAGPVIIFGGGGAGTLLNEGVSIQSNSTIDAGTGDLTITGTGNGAGNLNRGINAANSEIKSDGGNIEIDGFGGGPAILGIGADLNNVDLSTTGAGTVTLRGSGAPGTLLNSGVKLSNTTTVTSEDGAILIDGTANGSAAANTGVQVLSGSSISATGSGAVTLRGSGGTGLSNHGIDLATGTSVSVKDGDLSISGTGSGSTSKGVSLAGTSLTGTGTGNLTVAGTSTGTGVGNNGIFGSNAAFDTTAGSGSITLSGAGSNNGTLNNDGIRLTGGRIKTGGNGVIDIDGAGGNGTLSGNRGVYLGGGIQVAAGGTGAIAIDGTGGDGTAFNDGVYLNNASVATAGTLTIAGTGSIAATGLLNNGVYILSNSTLNGGAGSSVTGAGGAAGSIFNHGIYILNPFATNLDKDNDFTGTAGQGATSEDLKGAFFA